MSRSHRRNPDTDSNKSDRCRNQNPQVVLGNIDHICSAGMSNLPAREEIRELTAPALILASEGDKIHPVSAAEELAGLLPGARLHVVRKESGLDGWHRLMCDFLNSLA